MTLYYTLVRIIYGEHRRSCLLDTTLEIFRAEL